MISEQNDKCPYCKGPVEYEDSSIIYGKSYGMIYICHPCDAYVGVHKGTDKALGTLANRNLREARKEAHYHFDKIAKTTLIHKIWSEDLPGVTSRSKAYKWLSNQMEIEPKYCHIAMMDINQCKRVVTISKEALEWKTKENKKSL